LETLVPAVQFYWHLETKRDLRFVREWARELYTERGCPSIDSVVIFKLQRVMSVESIRAERKLVETASMNLPHRWCLGYALDEELTDHSSLTQIRPPPGIAVFRRFFELGVDLCQEIGLIWGREIYFDATKVESNAGVPLLVPRFHYAAKTHLANFFAADVTKEVTQSADFNDDPPEGIVPLPNVANNELDCADPPPIDRDNVQPDRSNSRSGAPAAVAEGYFQQPVSSANRKNQLAVPHDL
jgi:transposase